jgi:hypothetical protein
VDAGVICVRLMCAPTSADRPVVSESAQPAPQARGELVAPGEVLQVRAGHPAHAEVAGHQHVAGLLVEDRAELPSEAAVAERGVDGGGGQGRAAGQRESEGGIRAIDGGDLHVERHVAEPGLSAGIAQRAQHDRDVDPQPNGALGEAAERRELEEIPDDAGDLPVAVDVDHGVPHVVCDAAREEVPVGRLAGVVRPEGCACRRWWAGRAGRWSGGSARRWSVRARRRSGASSMGPRAPPALAGGQAAHP